MGALMKSPYTVYVTVNQTDGKEFDLNPVHFTCYPEMLKGLDIFLQSAGSIDASSVTLIVVFN